MKQKLERFFDAACLYSVYGLIFIIPFSSAGVKILFGLSAVFFLARTIITPDLSFLKNSAYGALGLFFLWNSFSLLNSGQYFSKSLHELFANWGESLLLFIIVRQTLSTRARIRNAVCLLLAAGCIAALDGLYQRIYLVDFILHKKVVIKLKKIFVTGPFNYYNNFGVYLSFVLIPAVAFLLKRPLGKARASILVALIALAGAALFFTLSRGAWLSFFTGLILLGIFTRRIKLTFSILIISIGLLVLLPGARERVAKTFSSESDAGRFEIWKAGSTMIAEHPFLGKGSGTFQYNMRRYYWKLGKQYAHNSYLQIAAEAGMPSLCIFLLFLWLLLRQTGIALEKNKDILLIGLSCAVCGFLIHSFLDNQFFSLQASALFWSMAGALSGFCNDKERAA